MTSELLVKGRNMSKLPDPFTSSVSRRNMLKTITAGTLIAAFGTNGCHAADSDKIKMGLVGCGGLGRGGGGKEGANGDVTTEARAGLFPGLRAQGQHQISTP